MAAFLANIGVNASHRGRSVIRPDGTFTVLPIPERASWAPPMRRLSDPDIEDLGRTAPAAWRHRAVHLDPDFRSDPPTYGDNCRMAGRAFSLRRTRPGDVIWFAARLHHAEKPPAIHLVGRLRVEEVLPDMRKDPGPGWWDANAHVRRARASGVWNSFWLFRGGEGSGWLPVAIPLARPTLEELFGIWAWPATATEQQVIAWHTRAVRQIA